MQTSEQDSNFPIFPFSMCARHPHMRMCLKLDLRPFHNSKGVLEIDLDGIKSRMSTAVYSAYPHNEVGKEE